MTTGRHLTPNRGGSLVCLWKGEQPSLVQVTAFSRWEKVLPKLVEDSRYKAIPTPKERRQVFDDFCRNVAAEQKAVQARKALQRWAGTVPLCCSGSLRVGHIAKAAGAAQRYAAAVLQSPAVTTTARTLVRHLVASRRDTSCLTVRLSLGTCGIELHDQLLAGLAV